MFLAMIILISKLPANLTVTDALTVAGGMKKLNAVDFSTSIHKRYTFWSGSIGGMFLALAYFGTDQSQVQRYISGSSLRECRLGLMFNAVCKIPMQFFILLLGVLIFVFYQFQTPPVYFNQTVWKQQINSGNSTQLHKIETDFATAHALEKRKLDDWLGAKHSGDRNLEMSARAEAITAQQQTQSIRERARDAISSVNNSKAKANDNDYVFITFILDYLPHGVIGLLVAAFFAAAMSSKAAELNSLGSTTTIDFYRHVAKRQATDEHYVFASKCFTILWGLVAIGFALLANLSENLIQAGNIVGSIFYGPMIGLFLIAFFLRWIGGTAVFWAVLGAQALVFVLYYKLTISYLWYNLIGCLACILLGAVLQLAVGGKSSEGLA
jgi:solute:Na+ symporter, SSS family